VTYDEWIEQYVSSITNRYVRGKCGHAVQAMKLEFPELRIAKGFAHVAWGRDQHWWCVAPDGTIVDPTVSQFPGTAVLEYEELDLDNPADVARIPIGKCMNCGEETYPDSLESCICSQRCADAFRAYLNNPNS